MLVRLACMKDLGRYYRTRAYGNLPLTDGPLPIPKSSGTQYKHSYCMSHGIGGLGLWNC